MNTDVNSSEEYDELKDAPILRSLRSSTPLQAPDGYFDRLAGNIQDKISQRNRFAFPVFFEWKSAIAIIGILILSILAGTLDLTPDFNQVAEQPSRAPEVSCEEMIESNYYLELDEELLASAISPYDTISSEYFTEEAIENYLLQTTEESFLTNEL